MAQTYSFLDGSQFSQTGQALNQTAQTSLSNLGVSGNSYSSYVPPSTSSPAPSTALTNPNLNFAAGGLPDNGSSEVAGAVAGVAGTPGQPSTTPSFDMASSGDYTKDPAYQTALNNYNQNVASFEAQANSLPSQTDLLNNARQTTGAATSQAEVTKLKTELAASVAAYNNEFARTEAKGIQEGVPALFYQGEIAAKQRQASILTTGISSRLAAAQDNWQMAEQLAEKTANLQWSDAQQKVDNKLKFIQLNQENLTRAEKVAVSKMEAQARAEQRALDTYKENMALALTTGVKTRFTNKNGEFFSTANGQAFSNPSDFFKAAGVKSFEEAYQKGLITDITGETLANQALVKQAQSKYFDVAIPLNATPAQVAQIIKGSRIYQDQVRGPVGSGGGGGNGLAGSYIIDANTDAAVKQIINSRPGDKGWGDTYKEIATKHGTGVADRYNGVLDNVFRLGASVDAAFNNMKLSGSGSSDYNDKQLKAITKINQDVSKNATYAKTTSMRGYVDNVTASLSQGTGVGDLAAINQFQKVIDEGAVTRDQDVKLIQESQSLSNTLKTKVKKLEKGEQLSPELRQQMRQAVESIYNAQTKALLKDPYISAKTKEAEINKIVLSDTILGELNSFDQGEITVRLKSTGELGTIPANEFDPNIYEKQ